PSRHFRPVLFTDPASTEIHPLSLHDALPISTRSAARLLRGNYDALRSWPLAVTAYNHGRAGMARAKAAHGSDMATIIRDYNARTDRKSTRLNSSHVKISYAVFCLKKKKTQRT